MPTFTRAEKAKELRREIVQRQAVYPRIVAAGKLHQAKADRQIAIMQAVLADYAEPEETSR